MCDLLFIIDHLSICLLYVYQLSLSLCIILDYYHNKYDLFLIYQAILCRPMISTFIYSRAPCQDFCSKLWRKALPKDVRWGKDVASPLQGGRRPAKRSSLLRLNLSWDTSIGQVGNWTRCMAKMEKTSFVRHLKALNCLTFKGSFCVTSTPLILRCRNRMSWPLNSKHPSWGPHPEASHHVVPAESVVAWRGDDWTVPKAFQVL